MDSTSSDIDFLKSKEVLPASPVVLQKKEEQREEVPFCNSIRSPLSSASKGLGVDLNAVLHIMKEKEVKWMSYFPMREYVRHFDCVYSTLSRVEEEQHFSLQSKLVALSYHSNSF